MKLLGYLWALPNTLLGLLLAPMAAAGRGRWQVVDGVLEASGPWIAKLLLLRSATGFGIEAITLGHVVLGRDPDCLDRCRAHEQVHVRQYARWGPLFLPAYGLSSLWQWARGRDPYRDNRFEREAYSLAPVEPHRRVGAAG